MTGSTVIVALRSEADSVADVRSPRKLLNRVWRHRLSPSDHSLETVLEASIADMLFRGHEVIEGSTARCPRDSLAGAGGAGASDGCELTVFSP